MPLSALILIALELVLTGLALYGGIYLLLDPTGASLGMDPALQYIPFVSDFMPFAIWLVVVFAALPAVLVYGLFTDRKWSIIGSLVLACLEIVWIGTQVVLLYPIGTLFLYLVMWPLVAGMGVVSIYLILRPSMRSYYHWGAAGGRTKSI